MPFFGAFLHDLRFIIESVPSVTVTCNKQVQKPIEMVSKLNGEENYFTRICVGGLLNTRKLELVHMLLQDVSMFHEHPSRMPDNNLDSDRFVAAAVSNLAANDRKTQAVVVRASLAKSSSTLAYAKPVLSKANSRGELSSCEDSNRQTTSGALDRYNEEVASLNDLASFISYASRQPGQGFQPIRDEMASFDLSMETIKSQHNVSYIKLEVSLKFG